MNGCDWRDAYDWMYNWLVVCLDGCDLTGVYEWMWMAVSEGEVVGRCAWMMEA